MTCELNWIVWKVAGLPVHIAIPTPSECGDRYLKRGIKRRQYDCQAPTDNLLRWQILVVLSASLFTPECPQQHYTTNAIPCTLYPVSLKSKHTQSEPQTSAHHVPVVYTCIWKKKCKKKKDTIKMYPNLSLYTARAPGHPNLVRWNTAETRSNAERHTQTHTSES